MSVDQQDALMEALSEYHRGVHALRRFVPCGLPFPEDRAGILKRVIREHRLDDATFRPLARRLDRRLGLPGVL